MIEAGWACLLALASLDQRTRPLALLLAVKWGLCYAAAFAGWWTLPAYIDIAAGTFGVVWAKSLPPMACRVVVAGFVLSVLAHAVHWMLWDMGIWVGVQYWLVMLGLFSAQVLALAWPRGQKVVRSVFRRLRRSRRRPLAAGALSRGRYWRPTANRR